jgi:ATP-dependent DNA helicase RecQ
VQKFLTGEPKLDPKQIETVAAVIADQEAPVNPKDIAEEVDASQPKISGMLHRLEDVGAVEVTEDGAVALAEDVDIEDAAESAAREQHEYRERKWARMLQMEEYAENIDCRRERLLCYFGDDYQGPCHNCDTREALSTEDGIPVDPAVGTRREVT